ncbi:MAG: hypothetical protein ACOYEV_10960 [Candidatus Nanopelagicales bacterium]
MASVGAEGATAKREIVPRATSLARESPRSHRVAPRCGQVVQLTGLYAGIVTATALAASPVMLIDPRLLTATMGGVIAALSAITFAGRG